MTEAGPITFIDGTLLVPDVPQVPFIEGDGSGPDIWRAARRVLDAAIEKTYGPTRRIEWLEVLAGEKAFRSTGDWLPAATVEAFRDFRVGIKGPLATPVGGGIRSLNVALRQQLDLYVCLRPVTYFEGVPSPVREPERVDMVIFRENTEDIYAGIEFEADTEEAAKFLRAFADAFPERYSKIRFPQRCGLGLKPVSHEGTRRLVRAAIQYAIDNNRSRVTLVHKGNIMKFTEGGFRDWGYACAREDFGATELDGGPWHVIEHNDGRQIVINDVIADAFLQKILLQPDDCDVIATLNLNGDYISDALAAQVGGIGIAPGGNLNYETGIGIFEATHGTAPDLAGKDSANPSSVILSGEMMLRHLGWAEAADAILCSMQRTIGQKTVTSDFARMMDGATELSCSAFGDALIENL